MKKMKTYPIRLKPDQITYLKSLPNAADFIRKAIDTAIIESSTVELKEEKVITLSKKIAALRQQINVLEENEEYKRAHERIKELESFFGKEEERITALYETQNNLKVDRISTYNRQFTGCFFRHPDNPKFGIRVPAEMLDYDFTHMSEKDLVEATEKIVSEAWKKAKEMIKNNFEEMRKLKEEALYLKRIIEIFEKAMDRLEEEIEQREKDIAVIQ